MTECNEDQEGYCHEHNRETKYCATLIERKRCAKIAEDYLGPTWKEPIGEAGNVIAKRIMKDED